MPKGTLNQSAALARTSVCRLLYVVSAVGVSSLPDSKCNATRWQTHTCIAAKIGMNVVFRQLIQRKRPQQPYGYLRALVTVG
ncbi:hypothetical protein F5H01DRAFT_329104 [Linnemannia elongata]|nr:hypothetical protein F5H01DRAFT_329104 [Linnemannia elongata]